MAEDQTCATHGLVVDVFRRLPVKSGGCPAMYAKRISKTLVIFCISLLAGAWQGLRADEPFFVQFTDANLRPNYDTFHRFTAAHAVATGKGIKVGIIDTYFAYDLHQDLYAGGKDFTGNTPSFELVGEHGLWMATTLRELAPGVEIYALNARTRRREGEAKAIAEAIEWAIENELDIITYSAGIFPPEDRAVIDPVVKKAIEQGIVITFIHYDLPENILPFGFIAGVPSAYARNPDVNVFHFDYNVLFLKQYEDYVKRGRTPGRSGDETPFFSISSTSVAVAAIVSLMLEKDKTLSVADCSRILIDTSRILQYEGQEIPRVVDAWAALSHVQGDR